jgi:hypothetical protein
MGNQIWSESDRHYVRENADRFTDAQGAAELSRITGRVISTFAWRKQRQKMGIRKKRGRGISEVEQYGPAMSDPRLRKGDGMPVGSERSDVSDPRPETNPEGGEK